MAKDKEPVAAPVEETWEQQQELIKREEFIKRNEEAIAARRGILEANGLADDTQAMKPDEAANRCCS